jgi:tetratricopeptide (TPR) repeat protein
MKKENYKKAIKCYKQSILYDADNETNWHNLRFAYYGTEEYEKAEMCRKRSEQLKKGVHEKENRQEQQERIRKIVKDNKGYYI